MKWNAAWLFAASLSLGCARNSEGRHAEGTFVPMQGFEGIAGKARFDEAPPGLKILVWLEGAPAGPKGVHVHEKGDCSAPLGDRTGAHFAPHGEAHGLPGTAPHHPGDLGNITIRDDGMGYLELTTEAGNLKPDDPMSFLNRAVVVQQGEDTGSPPSGDAAKPLACAVVKSEY
jgi:Cu-Zn family superoxide dismutase